MFRRNITHNLETWKASNSRKPLIIRGARQTGKTKAVEGFSAQFPHFVSLNLERHEDRQIFTTAQSLTDIVQAIEVIKKIPIIPGKTLLFLDEIQNSQQAIAQLRYFHEDLPALHVMGAGSLLEAMMQKNGFTFPVGRVEFLYLYPATFDEFLGAVQDEPLCKFLREVTYETKIPAAIHAQAIKRFLEYIVVGGMPEIVAQFAAHHSFLALGPLKEALLRAFEEDVHKYSRTTQTRYVQHILQTAPLHVGQRITYEHFGHSEYHSREIKRAMEILEYAMILQRVFGNHAAIIPIQPNRRVAPKLLYLDVGLVTHRFKIESPATESTHFHPLFQGALAEQIVGQELLALSPYRRDPPCFWYRNQPGATAEVDYCLQWKDHVIPIEVKSGKAGHLKSLQQFMHHANHPYTVRVSFGNLSLEDVRLHDMTYQLLNIPIYLLFNISQILQHWVR